MRSKGVIDMNELYIIKDRILEAMKARDMNANDLARASGLNKSSISRYLNAERVPRQDAIEKMAEALRVRPSYLLGYNVPMSEESAQITIELETLSPDNRKLLLAYYEFLKNGGNNNADSET